MTLKAMIKKMTMEKRVKKGILIYQAARKSQTSSYHLMTKTRMRSRRRSQSMSSKKSGHLEETAVGAKPWQMGGEVAAPARGENSLLAEDLEYDTAVRQAPVVTEDVARAL